MESAHNDRLQRLLNALLDVKRLLNGVLSLLGKEATEVLPEQVIVPPSTTQQSPVFLDFSLQQLKRPTRKTVALPQNLAWAMLEQLCRSRVSPVRFLLLPRFKQAVGRRRHHRASVQNQLRSTFRHELTVLRRSVEHFDLPVTVQRDGEWISARFRSAIETNIFEAISAAKEAMARLHASDFSGAIQCAEKALQNDFDCTAAAWVVVDVLQKKDNDLNAAVVMRAQVCLARAIMRYTAAARRLRGRTTDPDMAKASKMAARLLLRFERPWQDLLSWPFDPSSSTSHASLVNEFVETWVKASRGDALAYGRFTIHPVTVAVVEHLLQKRVKQKSNSSTRQHIANELTAEVFEKLLVNGWAPAPVFSVDELQDQIVKFLARRIDWDTLLRRGGSGQAEWRDDLHDGDEPGDDDKDAEEDEELPDDDDDE